VAGVPRAGVLDGVEQSEEGILHALDPTHDLADAQEDGGLGQENLLQLHEGETAHKLLLRRPLVEVHLPQPVDHHRAPGLFEGLLVQGSGAHVHSGQLDPLGELLEVLPQLGGILCDDTAADLLALP